MESALNLREEKEGDASESALKLDDASEIALNLREEEGDASESALNLREEEGNASESTLNLRDAP